MVSRGEGCLGYSRPCNWGLNNTKVDLVVFQFFLFSTEALKIKFENTNGFVDCFGD